MLYNYAIYYKWLLKSKGNQNYQFFVCFGFTNFCLGLKERRCWLFLCNHKLMSATCGQHQREDLSLVNRAASIVTWTVGEPFIGCSLIILC